MEAMILYYKQRFKVCSSPCIMLDKADAKYIRSLLLSEELGVINSFCSKHRVSLVVCNGEFWIYDESKPDLTTCKYLINSTNSGSLSNLLSWLFTITAVALAMTVGMSSLSSLVMSIIVASLSVLLFNLYTKLIAGKVHHQVLNFTLLLGVLLSSVMYNIFISQTIILILCVSTANFIISPYNILKLRVSSCKDFTQLTNSIFVVR